MILQFGETQNKLSTVSSGCGHSLILLCPTTIRMLTLLCFNIIFFHMTRPIVESFAPASFIALTWRAQWCNYKQTLLFLMKSFFNYLPSAIPDESLKISQLEEATFDSPHTSNIEMRKAF
jgi:hypothetical protein